MGSDELAKQRWEKKFERQKAEGEAAQRNLKDFVKEAIKNEDTHRNVTQELLDARRGNTSKYRGDEAGFNIMKDDDEVITGYGDLPWTRD